MSDQVVEGTERLMLRLPTSAHERLRVLARRQTLPTAVLARVLLIEALERAEKAQEARGDH